MYCYPNFFYFSLCIILTSTDMDNTHEVDDLWKEVCKEKTIMGEIADRKEELETYKTNKRIAKDQLVEQEHKL